MLNKHYIIRYAVQSNFDEDITQKQLQALFTAYCMVNDIEVDTAKSDSLLLEIYETADIESVDVTFDEFSGFMSENLV